MCCIQRPTDRISWPKVKSLEGGILRGNAKAECRGGKERKQLSLYLMSLDQPSKRTGGGWMEKLSEFICGRWNDLGISLWCAVGCKMLGCRNTWVLIHCLHRGGYVFDRACWFAQDVMDKFWQNLVEEHRPGRNPWHFGAYLYRGADPVWYLTLSGLGGSTQNAFTQEYKWTNVHTSSTGRPFWHKSFDSVSAFTVFQSVSERCLNLSFARKLIPSLDNWTCLDRCPNCIFSFQEALCEITSVQWRLYFRVLFGNGQKLGGLIRCQILLAKGTVRKCPIIEARRSWRGASSSVSSGTGGTDALLGQSFALRGIWLWYPTTSPLISGMVQLSYLATLASAVTYCLSANFLFNGHTSTKCGSNLREVAFTSHRLFLFSPLDCGS